MRGKSHMEPGSKRKSSLGLLYGRCGGKWVFIAELSSPHILFFDISLWLWLPKVGITDQEKQPPPHEGNSQEERGMHKP